MKIKPVLHRIIVVPDKVEESDTKIAQARAAGIIVELDKREQKATTTGTVLFIGTTAYSHQFGTTPEEQGITVGCKVLYAKYAGGVVPNTDYIILNDEDILAVLEE